MIYIYIYILSVPSSTGGHWRTQETTADYRGKFPRTHFGPVS